MTLDGARAETVVEGSGPSVAIDVVSRERTADPALWNIAWAVRNLTDAPLEVLQAWLPHGRFRSARRDLEPPLMIASSDAATLAFPVSCGEEPGTVVENCFVILNVRWGDASWRIFARLRVAFDAERAPVPETVLITIQTVGFSR